MNRRQLLKGLVGAAVAVPAAVLAAREVAMHPALGARFFLDEVLENAPEKFFMHRYDWRTVGYRWERDTDTGLHVSPVYFDQLYTGDA